MASGALVDYLGSGVASSRPASLSLAPGALGLFLATDTRALSMWDGTDWEDVSAGGGGGGAGNKTVSIMLGTMAEAITTGTKKGYWVATEAGTFVDLWFSVETVSSSGVVRIDMNNSAGTSLCGTRPSIDASEYNSLTGTAAVLTGTLTFAKGDRFTFDIDDAGTGAKAPQAVIEYTPA